LEKELLISKEEIQKRVEELAEQISTDYRGQEPIVIGVLKGVIFFFADLVRKTTLSTQIDFIRAASYGSGTTSKGEIRITKNVEVPVAGKPVILVEDIVDTGATLTHIIENLEQKGVASLRVCTLLDKVERREKKVRIDYAGFEVEEGFVVGYGLDYNEKYRHLPDIYILRDDMS